MTGPALRIVYVSCAGTGEIARFAMAPETGALTPLGGTLIRPPAERSDTPPTPANAALPSYSIPMAVHPNGGVLYAALRAEPPVLLSYAIDAESGALSPLGEVEVPDTVHIVTDHSGALLLGAAYHSHSVWVARLGQDGAAAAPHQVIEKVGEPHFVVPRPDNRFVYVAAAGGDEIGQYRLDLTSGRLELLDAAPIKLPPVTRPRHFAFNPAGDLLYCITETQALIDVYRIDGETGALTPAPELGTKMPRPDGQEHTVAADLHVTPDGRFLYASERTGSVIGAFAIDGSGALSLIDTWPADKLPRAFAIDPDGRFLIAAGQETGRITVHAIDQASGRLNERATYPAGAGAAWIEIVDLPR